MRFNFIRQRETFKKNIITKNNGAKLLYIDKAFFFPKFFKRILGAVIDKKGNLICNWNYNETLSNWSLNKILSFSFLNYDFFLISVLFF